MAILKTNIFLDNLVSDIATGRREVSTGPQMPAPELLLNRAKLHHQLPRSLAFEVLNQLADRQIRRTRQEHVHVIRRNVPLQNLNLIPFTNLDDQLTETISDSPVNTRLRYLVTHTIWYLMS